MIRSLRSALCVVPLCCAAACATVPSRVELVSPGPAPAGDPLDLVVGAAKVRCHVTSRIGGENRPVSSQDCGLAEKLELTLPAGSYEVVVEIPCQAKSVASFSVGEAGVPVHVTLPRPSMISLPRFVLSPGELPALPGSGSSPLAVKRGDPVTVVRLWQDAAGACKSAVVTGPAGGLLVSTTDELVETAPAAPTVVVSTTAVPTKLDKKAAERERAKRAARAARLGAQRDELRRLGGFPEGTAIRQPAALCELYGVGANERVARDPGQARVMKAERSSLRGQSFYLFVGFRRGSDELLRGDARCEADGTDTVMSRFKTHSGLPSPALSPVETEWLALATLDGNTSEVIPGGELLIPVFKLLALVKVEP